MKHTVHLIQFQNQSLIQALQKFQIFFREIGSNLRTTRLLKTYFTKCHQNAILQCICIFLIQSRLVKCKNTDSKQHKYKIIQCSKSRQSKNLKTSFFTRNSFHFDEFQACKIVSCDNFPISQKESKIAILTNFEKLRFQFWYISFR